MSQARKLGVRVSALLFLFVRNRAKSNPAIACTIDIGGRAINQKTSEFMQ
ncbi:MAG: hypothetical protein ACK5Z0_04395 [Planctomycetota bacterium]